MEKFAALVLCFLMVFTSVFAFSMAETEKPVIGEEKTIGDYKVVAIDSKTCLISGYVGSEAEVDIPERIEGFTVVDISTRAFSENQTVTSIEIPKTVEKIGEWITSGCKNLISITVNKMNENYTSADGVLFNKDKTKLIAYPAAKTADNYEVPEGVEVIEETAFERAQLTSVTLPESLKQIKRNAFSYSTITNIVIPNSVESIGTCAFAECENLEAITLGSSLEKIEAYTFGGCTKLASIEIPSNIKLVDEAAFWYCTSLAEIKMNEGLETVGDYAFNGVCAEELIFPDSVKSIGWLIYQHSQYDLPKSNFKKIYLGSGLENFYFANALRYVSKKAVTVSEENKKFKVEENAVFNKLNNELVLYVGGDSIEEYTVPEFTKSIGRRAFMYSDLKKVVIPFGIKTIAPYAFANSKIEEITVGEGIEKIGEAAFFDCYELKKAEFADTLYEVGNSAFLDCENLTDIDLGDGVWKIEKVAFAGCETLETLEFPEKIGYVNTESLLMCTKIDRENEDILYYLTVREGMEILNTDLPENAVIPSTVRLMPKIFKNNYLPETMLFKGMPPIGFGWDNFAEYEPNNLEEEIGYNPEEKKKTLEISYYEVYAEEWEEVIEKMNEQNKIAPMQTVEIVFKEIEGGEKYLQIGDVNKDYEINSRDIASLQMSLSKEDTESANDVNHDRKINSLDVSALQKIISFGSQYYTPETDENDDIASKEFTKRSLKNYIYDKYKDDAAIVVNSMEELKTVSTDSGFVNSYNEEFFKDNSLIVAFPRVTKAGRTAYCTEAKLVLENGKISGVRMEECIVGWVDYHSSTLSTSIGHDMCIVSVPNEYLNGEETLNVERVQTGSSISASSIPGMTPDEYLSDSCIDSDEYWGLTVVY